MQTGVWLIMRSLALSCFLLVLVLAGHGQVVSGQSFTSSLPAAFFTAGSGVNFVSGSVLQLFCTADSPSAVITWGRGGTVLTNDPPHIRIRSNSDVSTVTSTLTVDDFQTADNGAYQCRVGQMEMATTQTLTAFTPMNLVDTLVMFRHPSTRETVRDPDLQPDNRSAVAVGTTIDSDVTSNANLLLRCVAAHTNDVGQPLGTLVWTRNGQQVLTSGSRVTLTPLVFDTRYGADLQITNFTISDAGIYQCIATDNSSSDSDVVTSPPFRLDTDLAGDELRLERVSPGVIPLTPPNKLVIEVKASGRYREVIWTKDGSPLVVDSPNELPNFAEIFVRGVTETSDLGTYTVQLTMLDAMQTREPENLTFTVVPPTATMPPATTSPTLPPSPPTNLASSSQSSTSITLSWEQPAGDGVDRYDIVYTYQGGCNPSPAMTQFQGTATALMHTQGNLEQFSSYSVMVTAVNSVGESAPATGSFTTESAAPSAAPQNVRNTSVTISTITIQWDQVNCIDRNSNITGYTVRYGQTGRTTTDMSVVVTDDSDRMFTANGFTPGTSYEFQVAAVNSAGMTGVFSSSTTVETPALTVTLNGAMYTNNSVVLLTDIGLGDHALLCHTDNIQCCRSSDTGTVPFGEWYFPNGSQVQDGLDPSRNIFRNRGTSIVRLNNRNNAQSPSGHYRCEIPDASGTNRNIYITLIAAPSPPTSLASPSQSPTSITLSWEQPAGDVVDRYDIVYTYQGGCNPPSTMTQLQGTAMAQMHTQQNLEEFSSYTVMVTAVNIIGESAPATDTFTTAPATPTGLPQSVVMMSVTSTSITIQWGRVNCIDRNSEITGYTVRYGQTGSTPTDTEQVMGTSDSDRMFAASGLVPRTSYNFEVAAVSIEGTGPFSMTIIVETALPEVSVALFLSGQEYLNNSVISITDIGEGDNAALLCLSDRTQCCSSAETGGTPTGEWHFPDGSQVLDGQDSSRHIFRNRGPSRVRLNRRNNAPSPTGLYRCEIPDASGATQSVIVGVYTSSNQGAPSIQSVQFELVSAVNATSPPFNLHCFTTGGPVDFNNITWTRSGSFLPANHSLFQALDDGSTATYSNTLAVTGRETGQYKCQLQHAGSITSANITVEAAGEPVDLLASRAMDNLTSILVSWSAPAAGLTVTGYVIYYETSGIEESMNIGAGTNETTLTGLTIGNSYSISIIALSEQLPSLLVPAPFTVTLAPVPPPPAMVALVPQSPTSITLSWDHPATDTVDRYDIVYTYQGECSDYTQPENMATVSGGTTREYTLQNLQEFSAYSISIAAVNSTGPSTPASGEGITFRNAPSRSPQSVVMMSVTSSSITIQWGRVSCIDRNSEITGYTVRYGQTGSTPSDTEQVTGTSDSDRMFTASGLIPRTSYTFAVAADSSEGVGPFSTGITAETLAGLEISDTFQDLRLESRTTLTCMTDPSREVDEIQWLDSNGTVIVNGSESSLDLIFESITADLDGAEFTCRISFSSNETINQSITLTVAPAAPDTGLIVGVVIGVIGGLIVIIVIIVLAAIIFLRLRRQGKLVIGSTSSEKPTDLSKSLEAASYHVKPSRGDNAAKASPVVKLKSLGKVGSMEKAGTSQLGRQREPDTDDELEGNGNDEYCENIKPMREGTAPLSVADFPGHVKRMHADRDKLFELEFESLVKQPQSSIAVAKIPHNKLRNRFGNIFPYDYNRVVLQTLAEGQGTDYINASNIDGYNKEQAYIAAQGPMHNSVEDFWRMVWENRLPTIVMLTRCYEGKKKCEEYWPASMEESKEVGNGLSVRMTSLLPFAEYDIRRLVVTKVSDRDAPPLRVVHMHYTIWPDHGVPVNAVSLIHFIKKVRKEHAVTHPSPLLVHCSAGVGRTGSFVVLDVMLQRMKEEGNFNIYAFVTKLRTQRVYMVQSLSQYMFVHDALDELITCGETEVAAGDLRIVIHKLGRLVEGGISGFEKQFKTLQEVSSNVKKVDYKHAKDAKNLSKNRYPDKIPNDHNRVILRFDGATNSDYINASFVHGYKHRGAYIATQGPLKETVNDFWKMLLEYESKCIVMLCALEENGQESSCRYWPMEKGAAESFGKLQVTLTSEQDLDYFTIRKMEVEEEKARQSISSLHGGPFVVTQFHMNCWPLEVPPSTSAVLKLIDSVNKVQMSSGNKAITVMCNGGVGRSGAFMTIHTQLERLKTEGVVDVFQSLKSARIQRAGLVDTVDQYTLCHDALCDYLDSFDAYANFKDLV